jgi:hypothetical protein
MAIAMGREFLPAEQADSRGEFHARLELEYARVTSADARYADDHHGIALRGVGTWAQPGRDVRAALTPGGIIARGPGVRASEMPVNRSPG